MGGALSVREGVSIVDKGGEIGGENMVHTVYHITLFGCNNSLLHVHTLLLSLPVAIVDAFGASWAATLASTGMLWLQPMVD
jgi:hypothetical protein